MTKYREFKETIHTTVSPETKKKLMQYGKGILKDGIESVIAIAESKTVTVRIITDLAF